MLMRVAVTPSRNVAFHAASRRAPRVAVQRRCVRVRAAASSDPWSELGVMRNADSKRVEQAYRNALRAAGDNEDKKRRVEEAHNAIMMSSLTARLQGGMNVSKDIKYADKAVYFPWRPRYTKAEDKFIAMMAACQAAVFAYAALISTAGTHPVLAASALGTIGNTIKLNSIFPPPTSQHDESENKNQGLKNVLRGALLALLATISGMFIIYSAPDYIANALGKVMPAWFYNMQSLLLVAGTCAGNFIMSSFYR